MSHILLVEDDPRTVALLVELLATGPYQLATVGSGEEAVAWLREHPVDLVVLDVMLPGRDGFSICAEIRTFSAVRVLMLSARGGAEDRVDGLQVGADDYLPKPFDPRELVARIDALLRRTVIDSSSEPHVLRVRDLEVVPAERVARLGGEPVDLTSAEFDILRALVERAGRVVARERLMALARGAEFTAFDRAIDVHISHIRKKLGDDPRQPRWIRTIRGVGYSVPGGEDL